VLKCLKNTTLITLALASFYANADSALVSWYGPGFHGRCTAHQIKTKHGRTCERFNQNAMTAAHKTLPMGTLVEMSRKGKTITVRINDRGPYVGNRKFDLSKGAAKALGFSGVTTVSYRILPHKKHSNVAMLDRGVMYSQLSMFFKNDSTTFTSPVFTWNQAYTKDGIE